MIFEDCKLNISQEYSFLSCWWIQRADDSSRGREPYHCHAQPLLPTQPLPSPHQLEPYALRSEEAALLLQSRGSRLCTGCSSVLHGGTAASDRPVPRDSIWPGAGVASWGSDPGWLHDAHINKSCWFSNCTHLCLVHLESKLGAGKVPEIWNLITVWSLSTNYDFTHETLSGNKPQIIECMSPIWLPE